MYTMLMKEGQLWILCALVNLLTCFSVSDGFVHPSILSASPSGDWWIQGNGRGQLAFSVMLSPTWLRRTLILMIKAWKQGVIGAICCVCVCVCVFVCVCVEG